MIGTYLGVAVLHSLRDSMHGIAIRLVGGVTGAGPSRTLFAQGCMPAPPPSSSTCSPSSRSAASS
ncbi:hypothetical protein ACFYW1_20295 [Streptomyces sp. NPDC002669]|uniref:hypothetical protein n=1 Tax=Streptomyces sp. NPDC002669 TaxID=3364658 RepID=UPI0036B2976D